MNAIRSAAKLQKQTANNGQSATCNERGSALNMQRLALTDPDWYQFADSEQTCTGQRAVNTGVALNGVHHESLDSVLV